MKLKYSVLIISIITLLSGVGLAATTQSGFGTVIVTEVDFQAADGSMIHSTLQKPVEATSTNQMPGVVVIHGVLQSKEWLMAFGIEIARRGFVVLTIDANGHGNSDPGSGSGSAALDYITSLDYVDETQLAMIGHSMGGFIAWSSLDTASHPINALVLVGSGVSDVANTSYPHNMLVAIGEFDELFYPFNKTQLELSFGVTDIEIGVTYGNFSTGTARKLIMPRTNHLFSTIDPLIVNETVEWIKDSLKEIEDTYWIPADNQIYQLWLVGGFLSTFGIVITIFPLLSILIELKPLKSLKREVESDYAASTKEYFGYGTIYAIIGAGSFFPLLAIGFFLPSPQSYASSILSWILGSALIAALILNIILRKKKPSGVEWKKLWTMGKDVKFLPQFTKSLILALVVVGWLYAWTLLIDIGFALEFRAFLPGFNDLTLLRAGLFPIYSIIFIIYFLVDGMWLMGIMRMNTGENDAHGIAKASILAGFIKCIPYILLITMQMGVGLLFGYPIAQGMIGFSFLFFFAFTPWFAVGAVIIVFCYKFTGNYWLAALLNGLMFGWMLATILPFPS